MSFRKTVSSRYLFILLGFVLFLGVQVPIANGQITFTYTGNISAGGASYTPSRPVGATNACTVGGLSATDPPFNAFGFSVNTTGTYQLLMNSNTFNTSPTVNDGLLFLYQGSFDPANPLTNLIARGDGPSTCPAGAPGPCCTQCPYINACGLTAGTRYILVTLSTQTGIGGTFQNRISGPGSVQNPSAANGVLTGRALDSNGSPIEGVVTFLVGTQNRKTITDANGVYRFDEVETNGFYTLGVSRVNFNFEPSERSFSFLANNSDGVFIGSGSGTNVNPLDTPEYFVRQHYLDFLGREPDEAGFNFWSDEILGCGSDVGCIERRRVNVSAAYFKSIEFQNTGGFVDGLYRASYGRAPLYNEFMPDVSTVARNVVVGLTNWEQNLRANKEAFLNAWVERAAFSTTFDLMTDSHYVDTLIANTGVSFSSSERDTLVTGLTLGSLSRADVLRQIAEDQRFVSAKSNEVFVMMEYFGYLRRDPDAQGFQFWLDKLNQFEGNFEKAEMVKSFIVSGEYRDRFDR